eukprot:scaffold8237_cov161-Skeletonema_marinoi.AAC.1
MAFVPGLSGGYVREAAPGRDLERKHWKGCTAVNWTHFFTALLFERTTARSGPCLLIILLLHPVAGSSHQLTVPPSSAIIKSDGITRLLCFVEVTDAKHPPDILRGSTRKVASSKSLQFFFGGSGDGLSRWMALVVKIILVQLCFGGCGTARHL